VTVFAPTSDAKAAVCQNCALTVWPIHPWLSCYDELWVSTPEAIEAVRMDCANEAGNDNRSVVRMVALLAGRSAKVSGVMANRLGGSGMEAVISATRPITRADGAVTAGNASGVNDGAAALHLASGHD
jgi:acetyl-CoA acetyltransferase